MRALFLALPTAALLVACAANEPASGRRAVEGRAERGTTKVLAITSSGTTIEAAVAGDRTFRLLLTPSEDFQFFAIKDGVVQTLKFPLQRNGKPIASQIPASDSDVQFGALSTCDCNNDGAADEATPENDPLEQVDSDADGNCDLDDDDDDGDGENDDSDDDRDGDGEDDCDHDGGGDDGDDHDDDDGGDDDGDDGDDHDGGDDSDDGDDGDDHDGGDDGDDNGGDDNNDCGDNNGDDAGATGGDVGGDTGATDPPATTCPANSTAQADGSCVCDAGRVLNDAGTECVIPASG